MERYPKSQVPASTESPQGMHTIFADKTDSYAAHYLPDVVYRNVDGAELTLQLLLPEFSEWGTPREKYPLLVYVQGSAWRKQNVYRGLPQLCSFAHQGYVVASVEYRPSDNAGFPAQVVDTKAAIRFLRANAAKYGIDKDRIALWGDSSGGHTATMVGVTRGDERFEQGDFLEESSDVLAVVDFYGPTEIPKMFEYPRLPELKDMPVNEIPENILFGGDVKKNPEIAQPGNPLAYISPEVPLPPFLIMHGDEDELVPFNQSVRLYEKLVACQKSAQFYKVQGAMHGSRMWTKPVLDIVSAFLKAHV